MESGKAAVFRRYPFTLIMNRVVEKIVTYPLTLKIDPGSQTTGKGLSDKTFSTVAVHTSNENAIYITHIPHP